MTRTVEEASATMKTAVASASNLGIGQIVAHTIIINWTRFLVAFCEWVTRENNDLVGRGADSKDAWKLLSHCVRTVFKGLNKYRMVGRGLFIGDTCGAIVRG